MRIKLLASVTASFPDVTSLEVQQDNGRVERFSKNLAMHQEPE
jgi:hypothetical protein